MTTGKRPGPPRQALPIFAPPFAILPHPDAKGMWVVTSWVVLAHGCSCGSKKGELCQGHNGRYTAGIHIGRKVGNTKAREALLAEVVANINIRSTWKQESINRV